MAIDFNYFLDRKYAQLQQQADATTSNAASTASQANTAAITGAAAANLDNTRAKLAPAESASTIGLQGAQAGLLRTQASVLPGTAASENLLRASQTGLTNVQADTGRSLLKTGLFGGAPGSMPTMAGALGTVTGPATITAPGGVLPTATATGILPTAQKIGESHDAWVARLRGMGFGG